MSKKQNQKSTPSKKAHQTDASTSRLAAAKRARAASATSANAVAPADPRLPGIGTVVRKLDRRGKLRCKCRVVRRGIRYNGSVYRSLSAAAVAAAADLGLESPTQNGFVFWGLNA